MGIVLVSAMAFAALKSPSVFSSQVVVRITIASLTVATAGALFCKPNTFWAAFAVVGWGSLIASSGYFASDSPIGHLLPMAIWLEVDPEGYARAIRSCVFGFSVYRWIIFPIASLGLATLAGVVALGCTQPLFGRSIGERFGRRGAWSFAGIAFFGLTLATLRFPSSLWNDIFLHAVMIIVCGLGLMGLIGPHRLFSGTVAIVCICSFLIMATPTGAILPRTFTTTVYDWLYPNASARNSPVGFGPSRNEGTLFGIREGLVDLVERPLGGPTILTPGISGARGRSLWTVGLQFNDYRHIEFFGGILTYLLAMLIGVASGFVAEAASRESRRNRLT
jgi:hypothetical protein